METLVTWVCDLCGTKNRKLYREVPPACKACKLEVSDDQIEEGSQPLPEAG